MAPRLKLFLPLILFVAMAAFLFRGLSLDPQALPSALIDQPLPEFSLPVLGQVFEVDDATLQAMDAFEEVGLPTGYARVELELEPAGHEGEVLLAHAYMKHEHQLVECLLIEGPFADYTAELAAGYRLGLP